MTQLLIDKAVLEQLVGALEDLGTLTRYDWHPSSIWRRYYASAAGDFVDLRQLREKTAPIIAELRAALAGAEPVQKIEHGCHIDLDDGMAPDGCVLDNGKPDDCIYARRNNYALKNRESCEYWQPIAMLTPPKETP